MSTLQDTLSTLYDECWEQCYNEASRNELLLYVSTYLDSSRRRRSMGLTFPEWLRDNLKVKIVFELESEYLIKGV